MANPEHMHMLQQGVDAWNRWREEHREVQPDLGGANLHWVSLVRADFSGANLCEAPRPGGRPRRDRIGG